MRKVLLMICLTALGVAAASAVDVKVTVRLEGSGMKVGGLPIMAFDPAQGWSTVAVGEENPADTTYIFEDLPQRDLRLGYVYGQTSLIAEKYIPGTDTLTLMVEASVIPVQLKEVMVKAARQYITDDRKIFTPSGRAKKQSNTAADLLRNMAIPSILVNPEGRIGRAAGGEVSIFIDYLPASEADLQNIKTADVKTVEIFDFPHDPRFGGAMHVVNFVMQRYEYGGYTKISGWQGFEIASGTYGVGSKFTYKKMTYDFSASYNSLSTHHYGDTEKAEYRFPDQTIERTSDFDKAYYKQRKFSTSLRGVYRTQKTVISNTIGLSTNNMPTNRNISTINYMPKVYEGTESFENSHNSGIAPAWAGNYQFYLPNNFTLIFTPNVAYSYNKNRMFYELGSNSVNNDIAEKAWSYSGRMQLQKRFGNHSTTLSLLANGTSNNISYRGTTPYESKLRTCAVMPRLDVYFRFDKLWFQLSGTYTYFHDRANDERKDNSIGRYYVSAGYNINKKNSIEFGAFSQAISVPLSNLSPNIVFQNDIDAVTGNPALKAWLNHSLGIEYNFYPSDKVQFQFNTGYDRDQNPIIADYQPYEGAGRPVMLRKLVNHGFRNKFRYGVSASVFPVKNLTLQATLNGNYTDSHGFVRNSGNSLFYMLMANYSFGNFYVQGSYYSSSKSVYSNGYGRDRSMYNIQTGWGNGKFNVSFKVHNPFRNSWKGSRSWSNLPNYAYSRQSYTTGYHRYFLLSAAYTISYGKKVQRTADLQGPAGAQSGILQ